MQPEQAYTDDLDYLAQLGLEIMPPAPGELPELKRAFAKKHGFGGDSLSVYVSVISCVLLFTGTIYLAYSNRPVIVSSYDARFKKANASNEASGKNIGVLELDTVEIRPENFSKPTIKINSQPVTDAAEAPVTGDTLAVMPLASRPTGNLDGIDTETDRLKFMYNSGVRYIQNLKITEYERLYFNRKTNDWLGGTPAELAYSSQESYHIKQSAGTYLHEELENALRSFRRGDYGRSIYLFNQVAEYNPGDVNCCFYIAMSYFRREQYHQAISYFDQCLASINNTFMQESMFYKACALAGSGHEEEAQSLFRKIIAEDGFYAGRAEEMLSAK